MDDIGESSFVNLDDYRDTTVDCVDSSDGCGSEENGNSPGEKEVAAGDCYKSMIDLTADDILGLEFGSEAEACDFYSTYAKCHGFILRKDDVGRDLKGNIIMRQLVCNKEGSRNKKHLMRVDRKRDHKPITRTNCPARLRVHLDYRLRKWKVVSFEESHNHEIISAKNPPLIPTYRGTVDANKAQVGHLNSSGVRTCHIMGFMLAQKAGYSGVGFCKKDAHNHLDRQKHKMIDDGDAYAALSYIQAKADNDPMLFSKYTVTNDGKLKDLFWADGASRTDFQCFGDVLAFDMTYEKNKYNKYLVIFSGCNHHIQTIIFGCALVADKQVETCKWLLETFWEAMCGKHPKAVVTNGDSAMRDAIKTVFPNASHRLCACHLQNNASENVQNDEFIEDFKVAIYSNFSSEEFEKHWKNMVVKYGLQGNNWVSETYDNKSMWATTYLQDNFFGYIRTISHCTEINSLINSFVKRENIVDFLHDFERALRDYRYNEQMADLESMYSEPVMTTFLYEIEKDGSKIFTREIFKEVKAQIESVGALNVIERIQNENDLIFKMNIYCSRDTEFRVVYDKLKHTFLCNCRLFESRGIPCGHIICAMKHEHISCFPCSLICKRWTKTAKFDYISSISSEEVHFENMMMIRFGAIVAACNKLCHIAAKDPLHFSEAIDEISKLTDKFQKRDSHGTQISSVEIVGDPTLKTKCTPSKKKSWGKRRRCSNCNRTGHIIRRCPRLLVGDDDLTVDDDFSSSDSADSGTKADNDKGGMSFDQHNVYQFESVQTSNANNNVTEVNRDGGTRIKQKKESCSTQDSVKDSKMKSKEPNIMLPQYTMNTSFAPLQNLTPNYGLLNHGVPAISQYGGIPVYPQFPQVFPQYPVSVYPSMPPQFFSGVQNVNGGPSSSSKKGNKHGKS